MVIFHHQNAGQNHNLLTINKYFENGVKFKYLGMTLRIRIAFMKKLRTH